MIKIKFDVDHKVQQHDGKGPAYEKGKAYEFSGFTAESYARKYIARRYAHEIGEAVSTLDAARAEEAQREQVEAERKAQDAAKFAARSAVEIPENVEGLKWPDLRALASHLTDDLIHNKDEALAVIKVERGRRAVAG